MNINLIHYTLVFLTLVFDNPQSVKEYPTHAIQHQKPEITQCIISRILLNVWLVDTH